MRALIIDLVLHLASATSVFTGGQLGTMSRNPTKTTLDCEGKIVEYQGW